MRSDDASGRAPRVAPTWQKEVLQQGPRWPKKGVKTDPRKAPRPPGGLHQGAKWRPKMVSAGAAKRFKMAQDCVEVSSQTAPKGAQARPQEGSKRVSKIMQNERPREAQDGSRGPKRWHRKAPRSLQRVRRSLKRPLQSGYG